MTIVSCYIYFDFERVAVNLDVPAKVANRVYMLENSGSYEPKSEELDYAISLENTPTYNILHEAAMDYLAIYLADGTFTKGIDWDAFFELQDISSQPIENPQVRIEGDILDVFSDYLKVIQWKCRDRMVEYFCNLTTDQLVRGKIRDLAAKHNSLYSQTFFEWEKDGGFQRYDYEQFRREYMKRAKDASAEEVRKLGYELQDEIRYVGAYKTLNLTFDQLNKIINKLNRIINRQDPQAEHIKIEDTVKDLVQPKQNDEEPPAVYTAVSVGAISTPMGGQPGWRRRRRCR